MKRQAGLTLLEVMVALLVVAITLGAVISGVGAGASNHAHLVQQTEAQWVAANALIEARLGLLDTDGDPTEGTATMGHGRYTWRMTRQPTSQGGLQRLTVSVALADDPDRQLHGMSTLHWPVAEETP